MEESHNHLRGLGPSGARGIRRPTRGGPGVTGVCGPLPLNVLAETERLPELGYAADDWSLSRFREQPEQFFQFGPSLSGRHVPVHRPT